MLTTNDSSRLRHLQVTLVKYGDQDVAFKKFFRRSGASGAAAIAEDAVSEFNVLATAHTEAQGTANGAHHLNVIRPILLVADAAHGGNITGFLMERLEGERCLYCHALAASDRAALININQY